MFIETKRLIIRNLVPEDADSYIEMAYDGSLQDIFGDCTDCREWMESWIAKSQALYDHDLGRVLSHWGLQDSSIKQIYETAWQIGSGYVLKIYQDQKMLERNLNMLRLLYQQNIPVARIIPTHDNAQYVSCDDAFFFMSEKLPGSQIKEIDGSIARSMGEIIARLHTAFQKCEPLDTVWDNSLLGEMNGWVLSSTEKNGWKYISKEDYLQTVSKLTATYDLLPVQLIHRDIHFGNFLFADGAFSGYIDFDLSQRNIRIFDLCYFVLGLLSEEEDFKITEETWFNILGNVFDGYESIQKLTFAEKEAIPYVMECIELLFAAWFEDQNDSSCARNAIALYQFVRQHEKEIRKILRLS